MKGLETGLTVKELYANDPAQNNDGQKSVKTGKRIGNRNGEYSQNNMVGKKNIYISRKCCLRCLILNITISSKAISTQSEVFVFVLFGVKVTP